MQLSILIRNLNEATTLQQTLCALKKQQTNFDYEVVMIDNESDDNSVEVATSIGCKVFTLKRNEFTFGHALNFGIERCRGEIILILSAHVILLNEFFLQNILTYFNDTNVAALRFIQSTSGEEMSNAIKEGAQKLMWNNSLNFVTDNWKKFIVNHCAAIRKSCWQIQRFDEKIFASEDKIWSLEILKKGYSILYNVPGFYLYAKPFSRSTTIKRTIIEEAAKEMVTGKVQHLLSKPYARSFFAKLFSGFKRLSSDLKNHKQVYKGMKEYRLKFHGSFIYKENIKSDSMSGNDNFCNSNNKEQSL